MSRGCVPPGPSKLLAWGRQRGDRRAERQGRCPRDAAIWAWVPKAPRGLCGAREPRDHVAHTARLRGLCGDRPWVRSDAGREKGLSEAGRPHQGRSPHSSKTGAHSRPGLLPSAPTA